VLTPRRQGDLGEFSAIEWLGLQGRPVYVPIGHSPDCDLVTVIDGKFVGVEVKTSTVVRDGRFAVNLRTFGGNRSWNGVVKRFSPQRCDWLFVLVADGRCWFIPAEAVHDEPASSRSVARNTPPTRSSVVARSSRSPRCDR
jgi:PD-(D/E)XK nuclease superfamily protein